MSWRMACIGTGPGPKNVLAERGGTRVVVPYAIWKHKLSKEEPVSEDTGTYIVAGGVVQQFKKDGEWKPVVSVRDVNGQQVASFTIKTFVTQKLVSVSLWPEFAALAPHIVKGAFVSLEGKMREETKNGVTYYNVSATQIAVLTPVARAEREVVNAQPAQAATPAQPEAQPAVAAPAATGASTIF